MGSKLGIVFAFILSIAAAGGSYYLYQGWVEERTVRAGVEAKYDQVKEKMVAVQSEKEELQAKSEEYRTKAEAMQGQLEKLQAEQSRIDSEKTALEAQLKDHQGMIADLQKQVGELAKKAKEAQAACGVTPADLDTAAGAEPFQGVTSSAVTSGASVVAEPSSKLVFKPVTASATAAPAAFGESATSEAASNLSAPVIEATPSVAPSVTEAPVPAAPVSAAATPVPEPVKSVEPAAAPATSAAKVLTVNRKFNFVVINQGMQDGLKIGDKLKVLKQGQESATIQVEKLYDKFSAATLVEEDPKQQVLEGDEIRKV